MRIIKSKWKEGDESVDYLLRSLADCVSVRYIFATNLKVSKYQKDPYWRGHLREELGNQMKLLVWLHSCAYQEQGISQDR